MYRNGSVGLSVGQLAYFSGPDWGILNTEWIEIDNCGLKSMNPNNFEDPLTFPLVSPESWQLWN